MIALLLLSLLAGLSVEPGKPVDSRGKAETYLEEGLKLWKAERYSLAGERFDMAVLIGRFSLDPTMLAEANRMAAEAALRTGRPTVALANAREFLAWARRKGKPVDRAQAHNLMAGAHLELGALDATEDDLDFARRELKDADDPLERERTDGLAEHLAVRRAATGEDARPPASRVTTQPAVPLPSSTPAPLPRATPIPVGIPVATPVATPIATPVATPIATPIATPVATPVATPAIVARETAPAAVDMAPIPSGTVAGDKVAGFFLDRREVSIADFIRFATATGAQQPEAGPDSDARLPVAAVTLERAKAYAAWSGSRLPTEREWERAARGRDNRRYAYGPRYDPDAARVGQPPDGGPVAVGSYAPNAFGVFDLSGNVAEWCLTAGGDGVLCGGGWTADASAQNDTRERPEPGSTPAVAGFRCARDERSGSKPAAAKP